MASFADYVNQEKAKATGNPAPETSDDALDRELERLRAQVAEAEKAQQPRTVPPKDQAALQRKIDAGMSPLPGGLGTLAQALGESYSEFGRNLNQRALAGLSERAWNAVGLGGYKPAQPMPEPGKVWRHEDYWPSQESLSTGPVMAVDAAAVGGPMAKAGQTLAQAPATLARMFGAKQAQTAVRPGLQAAAGAAATGGLYNATDTAIRGGTPGEIFESAAEGASVNTLLGQVPAVAGMTRDAANKLLVNRAAQPLLQIGQGKNANKALLSLGKGDAVAGRERLGEVLEEQGMVNQMQTRKGRLGAQEAVESRLESVWENELGPIRREALASKPNASTPFKQIEERLNALVEKGQISSDRHDDVLKAIAEMKEKAKLFKGNAYPVENLYTKAREFENDGFGKSEPKFKDGQTARDIGQVLRNLADERIGVIYEKDPKLTAKVLGREAPENVTPLSRTSPDDMEVLGDKYADARRRYRELKAIEPAAQQLTMREGQQRPGLISRLTHGGQLLGAAAVGNQLAGLPGTAAAIGGVEAARLGYPYTLRATRSIADQLAGPAYNPGILGSLATTELMPPGTIADMIGPRDGGSR